MRLGWMVAHTDEYSPFMWSSATWLVGFIDRSLIWWIHHCVHVEWLRPWWTVLYRRISYLLDPPLCTCWVVQPWWVGCTDRSVLSLDPLLCTCWVVQPWWTALHTQISTLPGSTTVYMLSGATLVGRLYRQISTLSGSITVYMLSGCDLGGQYYTDGSLPSLDPSLCTCWVVQPWWVGCADRSVLSLDPSLCTCWVVVTLVDSIIQTDHYPPWIHHCVHVEWCNLVGLVVQTDQYSLWIHHCVHVEWLWPWWTVLYRRISTLPGSITVYMLSGATLVGWLYRQISTLPGSITMYMLSGATLVGWLYRQISTLPGSITVYMLSGCDLGGEYYTDRSVPSLDPSLCTCWVM